MDVALCIMIATWTLVAAALGVMGYLTYRQARLGLERANAMLETGRQTAEDVRAPVRAVAESFREVFAPAGGRDAPIPTS